MAHKLCAQPTASLLSENPEGFSDSLREPAAFAAGPLLLPYPTGADLSISEGKMSTKKDALTAAFFAEQKEGKRKGRKQMKKGKCAYL